METSVSIRCLQRSEELRRCWNKTSLCFQYNNIAGLQDWYSTDHTPLQDDGDEPMMDLVTGMTAMARSKAMANVDTLIGAPERLWTFKAVSQLLMTKSKELPLECVWFILLPANFVCSLCIQCVRESLVCQLDCVSALLTDFCSFCVSASSVFVVFFLVMSLWRVPRDPCSAIHFTDCSDHVSFFFFFKKRRKAMAICSAKFCQH